MKFIDFFAGVGGFRRGMESAGHKCVGFCEFDQHATRSYIAMHLATPEELNHMKEIGQKQSQKYIDKEILPRIQKKEWYANDVRTVRTNDIPRADCWCFGFPCQDISTAGKRTGLSGNRSGLFYTIMRLVEDTDEENKPTYLFIENVKNLLSINRGFDFLSILSRLDKNGYDAEWGILNSAEFGVSHNRERVFIIGRRRNRSTRKIFPVQGTNRKNSCKQLIGGRQGQTMEVDFATNTDPYAMPVFVDLCKGNKVKITRDTRCLQARYSKGVANRKGEISGVCVPVLTPDRVNKRQNGRRIKTDGEPMFTLTSQDRHGIMVNVDKKYMVYAIWIEELQQYCAIRKLTPRECFRLQGWEDVYFDRAALVCSDSQLYKQAGNGVTVNVIEAIAKRMEV